MLLSSLHPSLRLQRQHFLVFDPSLALHSSHLFLSDTLHGAVEGEVWQLTTRVGTWPTGSVLGFDLFYCGPWDVNLHHQTFFFLFSQCGDFAWDF